MTEERSLVLISDAEVGDYAVCPESWRLKYVDKKLFRRTERSATTQKQRSNWVKVQDLSTQLKRYAGIAYGLLVIFVFVVFLLDRHNELQEDSIIYKASNLWSESNGHHWDRIYIIIIILGVIIFVWDLFDRKSKVSKKEAGIDENARALAVKDSSLIPERQYLSEENGLSSKPDAVYKIDKHIIPVDRYTSTNKVRDRHVLRLLLHMRLIGDVDGIEPPYGLLIMGPKARTVRIESNDERRRWLDSVIAEMRAIIDGVPAEPLPSEVKCLHCDVKSICKFRFSR